MDQNPSGISNKSNKSSERFLDRILYRFKMIKHSSRGQIENNEDQAVEYVSPVTPSSNPEPTEEEEINHNYQYEWDYRRISPEDLHPFCEQLGKFLQYVRSIQELTYFTFDYPCVLQTRLEREANELDSLYQEVRAAVVNIERIGKQRKAVRKEKSNVKKTLKKLRDDEAREMESTLQAFDKTMYQRWENIKNCHKPEILENLLIDVKNKQQALDNLSTLITRKLGNIQFFTPIPCPDVSGGAGKDKPTTATGATGTDDRQTIVSVKRHHHNNNSNLSRYRRRRAAESCRNQDNSTTTVKIVGSQNTDADMSLVPFPITAGHSSNHSLSSRGSDTWARPPDTSSNNSAGSSTVAEFHTEMRSVLQALFGDARGGQAQPPTTTITINDANVTAASNNPDNTDSCTNNTIELYTIRRPPSQ